MHQAFLQQRAMLGEVMGGGAGLFCLAAASPCHTCAKLSYSSSCGPDSGAVSAPGCCNLPLLAAVLLQQQ